MFNLFLIGGIATGRNRNTGTILRTPTTWDPDFNPYDTLSLGNTSVNCSHYANGVARSTFGASSGKWYWEFTPGDNGFRYGMNGVVRSDITSSEWTANNPNSIFMFDHNLKIFKGADIIDHTPNASVSSVYGVLLDLDNLEVSFISSAGATSGYSLPALGTGQKYHAAFGTGASYDAFTTINFGQNAYTYTPPVGVNTVFGPPA